MQQVAARISDAHELWLKQSFKTKSAGAEFLLPWAIEMFQGALQSVCEEFSQVEMKAVLASYEGLKLLPSHCRHAYLMLHVEEACRVKKVHVHHGASKSNLEVKLKRLDEMQASAVIIWASAYWTSKEWKGVDIEEYVRQTLS